VFLIDEADVKITLVKLSCLLPLCVLPQAFLIDEADGKITFVGNRTECALLMLLRKWGIDYKEVHAAHEKSLFRVGAWGSLFRRGGYA
jgi:Ca2+-transporting ATPase